MGSARWMAAGEERIPARSQVTASRRIAVVALFFLAVSAASVVAASAANGPEELFSAPEAPSPSGVEVAAVEDERQERAEWLSSPEAQKQREASRAAYTTLSAGEAQSLLVEAFPEQLAQLNADPARLLSELEIEEILGTYGALASNSKGETSIVESSIQIVSEVGGEGKQPVDLSLERSGNDFVSENPLTEVKLPVSTEELIQLQNGIEVQLPANDAHDAQTLGTKNLFYPETATATDTLLSPIAAGVEVFEQLRSPESPEQFRFALQLPAGATLRPTDVGGAEVLSSSEAAIGQVPSPSAVDAQGTLVPVTMSVEGESLVLDVPHRSHDFAYPILVDPQFLEEGYVAFNYWAPSWNAAYNLSNSSSLLASAQGNGYVYGANTYGHWVYTAPGQTTYIAAATYFSNTFTLPENCAKEQPTNQPHGYAGLFNPSSGGYVGLGIWYGGNHYMGQYQTGWVGGPGVRQAVVGIGTGPASVHHKCAFTFSVGGVTIQEKDPEAPTIYSVVGASGNWVKDITVTAYVSDPGLGVKGITLSPEGSLPYTYPVGNCTGTYTSRCPASAQASFGVSYFFEGERNASLSAYDPLGPDEPAHVSSSYKWTTRLDRSKPEVELEGEFTEALEEAEEEEEGKEAPELHLPVYNLKIEATDKAATGNPLSEPKARRSGVKNIAVFLDGKELKVPWLPQGCSGPTFSCPMKVNYPVPMDEVKGGGVHKLNVIATDQVGNARERPIEFEYFPATGIKDEYVMHHFPLPNGEGESEEEHPNRPELAVNVTNGNLVYRQKDVEVTGPAVDLEVERYYNSQLPDDDNTEWGDGWTLAQTPKLEPEETKEGAPPVKASMVRTSGILESAVGLPTKIGATQFDKKLQAVVTKEPDGGYEVDDQSDETSTSLAFDKVGKVTEMRTPGAAKIDYSYEAGDLSEIAVEDPASSPMSPTVLEELQEEPAEWSLQTTPNPAPPKTNAELSDVACSSASACLAVGYDNANGRSLGEFWNGSKWVAGTSVSGRRLKAVSCGAPSVCWVLATNSDGSAATEYWEGQIWEGAPKPAVPSGGSSVTLNSISCTAAMTCTAVGSYVKEGKTLPLIERLSSFNWSVQNAATTSSASLKDVSCVSASECVAIGFGEGKLIAERWNGTTWSVLSAPPNPASKYASSTTLTDLSCTSSSACMAIGFYYKDGKVVEEEVQQERFWFADRWNGSSWSAAGQGTEAAESLNDLACTTATNCTAVGTKGSKTLALSWNGSSWSTQSSPNPEGKTPILSAISCSATAACTSIGKATGGGETVSLAERWNGTSWSLQTTPNPAPPKTNAELSDVACSSASACLAVGYDNANGRSLGEFWNGSKWVAGTSVSGRRLKAVSCGAPSVCWVLATNSDGSAATEYWEGQIWEGAPKPAVPSGGSSVTLNSISCTAAMTCTAVGSYVKEGKTLPLIERLSSFNWSVQNAATTSSASLKDVSCVSASECVAIGFGEGKLIAERWNGTTWSVLSAPPNPASKYASSTTLTDLSCTSSSACMAIGFYYKDGKVVEEEVQQERFWFADRWNGSSWSAAGQGTEAAESLNDLACTTATNCTAVGTKGSKTLALSWNGSSWSTQSSPNPEGKTPILSAISCSATAACTSIGKATGGGETVSLAERTILRPEPAPEEDPKVEVNTSAGLVTSVQGEEAGPTTYTHTAELLTAVNGPKGKTQYVYDSEKRLTKVTLPNGTWGEVKYDSFSRVEAVIVSVEGGKAKTAKFTYKEEPRRTTVSPEGERTTVYDIALDGSILKWWNTKVPPEIQNLSGTLYANKETEKAITPGDYSLLVQAYSVEGVALIEIVANGDQVVSEKTCKQTEGTSCKTVEDPWITNTGNWPPGILQLEVIITDTTGNVESVKFWVNVPYTPPSNPEADEPPIFEDILHFREEFGLDLDLKGNELAIVERISNSIGDWYNPHTPEGEVARATYERWSVPLRAIDAAELEYRDWFYNHNAQRINQWLEETQSSSFAGYYIDHAAGGVMHIGFLGNQAEQLASLEASLSLAAGERLQVYPVGPTVSYLSVRAASESVSNALESNSTLSGLVVDVKFDESGRAVRVGTPSVAQVEGILHQMFGSNAPIVVEYETADGSLLGGRWRNEGRMRAGDGIFTKHFDAENVYQGIHECTAAFGAKDKAGESHGQPRWRLFVLTAGHCNPITWENWVYRTSDGGTSVSDQTERRENEDNWRKIGEVRRSAYRVLDESPTTDGEAIRVESAGVVPQGIFGSEGRLLPTEPAATAREGDLVCFSGVATNGVSCGPIIGRTSFWAGAGDGVAHAGYWVRFNRHAIPGDSGAPVYSASDRRSIGLVSAGRHNLTQTLVQPLRTPPGMNSGRVPGILDNPYLRPLSLKLGN